jgi:hypothetical protein
MGTKRVGWARIRSLINENGNAIQRKYETITAVSSVTELTAADSGETIWLDGSTGFNLTLPAAAAGLSFKIILKDAVQDDASMKILCASGDCFYGSVEVVSTTDHKRAVQHVDYDTGTTTVASYDVFTMDSNAASSGGASGDVITLTAVDATAWHVDCRLVTTDAAPASIAVIAAS